MKFRYMALTIKGEVEEGEVEAESEEKAREVLEARRLLPHTLIPASAANLVDALWPYRTPYRIFVWLVLTALAAGTMLGAAWLISPDSLDGRLCRVYLGIYAAVALFKLMVGPARRMDE